MSKALTLPADPNLDIRLLPTLYLRMLVLDMKYLSVINDARRFIGLGLRNSLQ